MPLLNMMKNWFLFLIALIATGTLGVLYSIFEVHILQLLSTWPKSTQPQNILRISLGVSSLLILALAYCISELKSQLRKKKTETITKAPSSPPPKSKYKEYKFEGLIWAATNHPITGLHVYNNPRCEAHDYPLTFDGKSHHCPEHIYGRCNIKLSPSDLSRLKRIATSYIDKQFRDEPPPPPSSPRPKSNWVMGWRR